MTLKIICPCGSSINHNYYRIHIYSKKHLQYISNPETIIKDYSEIYNEDLLHNLNQTMITLDENKSEMKEGEYLNECNKLLKEYNDNKTNSIINSYVNLIKKFKENNRLYNKIISEIIYKNNKIISYQFINNKYFNYYFIDNQLIIIKIDYLRYILYSSCS
jgi:hypothetical protein